MDDLVATLLVCPLTALLTRWPGWAANERDTRQDRC